MKVLGDKILYELLPIDEQPKSSIFQPNMDMLKRGRVIKVGKDCKEICEGDVITFYVNHMRVLDKDLGFLMERDVIFINEVVREGKVELRPMGHKHLTNFDLGEVVSSGYDEVSKGAVVGYQKGQSHILPNNNEILSKTQIFYVEEKGSSVAS